MFLDRFYRRQGEASRTRAVLTVLSVCAATLYFGWRVTTLNPEAPLFSVIFLFAELFGFTGLLLTVFSFWRARERHPEVPEPGLSVDVFIPTLNEPMEVVRLTASAAKAMRYPHTTWILDDGNRKEIRELAREIDCRYLARTENTNAKAGNLNNALRHSSGDFILILDADHVPQTWTLDRLLGYFRNPNIALVQSPQDYYTTDTFQFRNDRKRGVLWHDQMLFYRIGQAGRDHWNATSCCGTNVVLRRRALDDVGGIATETVTEDMHTSIRLQKKGWGGVFHPEPLVFGIAATDYVEFLQQRLRWGHGNVQTLREENLPFCENLSWAQKLCNTGLGISYFEGWTRLIFYLTPAIVLFTGVAPIGDTQWFLWFFLPYFILICLLIEEMGRGDTRLFTTERLAMARFPVYMLATFGLLVRRRHWRITSKVKNKQVPAWLILPQMSVFAVNVTALLVAAVHPPARLTDSMTAGTIVIICLWALYHTFLSAAAIVDVVRDTMRIPSGHFRIPLPFRYRIGQSVQREAVVTGISTDELVFSPASSLSGNGEIDIELFLPEGYLPVRARVRKLRPAEHGENRVCCRFLWETAAKRDLLNRQLHACTWHRLITWPASCKPTWPQRVAGRFGRSVRERPWQPALYSAGSGDDPRLGLYLADEGEGDGGHMLVFSEQDARSREFELVTSPGPADGTRILTVRPGSLSEAWPGAYLLAVFPDAERAAAPPEDVVM